jgi:hypothetical protein
MLGPPQSNYTTPVDLNMLHPLQSTSSSSFASQPQTFSPVSYGLNVSSHLHHPVHLLLNSRRETEGRLIDTEGEGPKTKDLSLISIILGMQRNGIDTRRVEE